MSLGKVRKTVYFTESTWDLFISYQYRYGWKDSSNSDLIDYIVKSFISAEKKRLFPGE